MLLTVGSGYLARAGMYYSDAAQDDGVSQEFAACSGCLDNNQIMDAYVESMRGKMQGSLQDMILNAGIGVALFCMGAGFSMIYIKWYRKTEPIL